MVQTKNLPWEGYGFFSEQHTLGEIIQTNSIQSVGQEKEKF